MPIPIVLPTSCPSCRQTGTLRDVGPPNEPYFARITLTNIQSTLQGNIILGGNGIVCRCFVCVSCGLVSFYYDEQVTHSSAQRGAGQARG